MQTALPRYAAPMFTLLLAGPLFAQRIEYLPGIEWPEPPIVTPGKTDADPPSDAVVLFNGKNLSAWEGAENWKIENGEAVVGEGQIKTKRKFGDMQLHIEWSAPVPPTGESQGRGNSGVMLMEKYELQVLDSFKNETYFDGQAGAIYKQSPPMVNAMRPPGEWNTYDVIWTAPRFSKEGALESPAYITALHNGVLIHNHFELAGASHWHQAARYETHDAKMPIALQDHGNPVRYRNIWVRDFSQIKGTPKEKPAFINHDTGQTWEVGEQPPATE